MFFMTFDIVTCFSLVTYASSFSSFVLENITSVLRLIECTLRPYYNGKLYTGKILTKGNRREEASFERLPFTAGNNNNSNKTGYIFHLFVCVLRSVHLLRTVRSWRRREEWETASTVITLTPLVPGGSTRPKTKKEKRKIKMEKRHGRRGCCCIHCRTHPMGLDIHQIFSSSSSFSSSLYLLLFFIFLRE